MGLDAVYFPYFRGKQYELITIRENADLLANSRFVPIIEPVKETLKGLERALISVGESGGSAVVIVNPYHGDHSGDGAKIVSCLGSAELKEVNISPAILLKEQDTVEDVLGYCEMFESEQLTLVHDGFTHGSGLAKALDEKAGSVGNIFIEADRRRLLYRRHFQGNPRILVSDGFLRRPNREYPALEPFSDLHITFREEGMNGFGDFLTVGNDFSESGGPAYAVAIHITFIDSEQDGAMFIRHFKSRRQDSPTDPAGKFAEALESMIEFLDSGASKIRETNAIREFRTLHANRHYPGLGYAKKLSMQHHLETLSDFFKE